MSEAPIAASPLDVGVMPLAEQVASLRRGNTALIEALMDMVNQFFYHKGENGEPDEDGPILRHSFMSAEEGAISVLMQAGFAEEAPDKGYRLLWDKLEQRRKDVGLAQQTWEEAVRECVTDPAEVERLLALDNDATTEEVHAAVKGHNVEVQGPGAASSRTVPCNDGLAGTVLPRLTFDQERTVSNCKGECVNRDKVKPGFEINDCPNMKEVEGDLSMDSEHYKCDVCGKRDYLDYEEMK